MSKDLLDQKSELVKRGFVSFVIRETHEVSAN